MKTSYTQDIATLTASILSEVKAHLGVDGTGQDTEISNYINASIEVVNKECNVELGQATVVETFNSIPSETMFGSVSTITSIEYIDTDDTQQTWDSTNYYTVIPAELPATITPVASFPSIKVRPDAVSLTYEVGCMADGTNYTGSNTAIEAVKNLTAYLYEHRGDDDVNISKAFYRLCNLVSVRGYTS